MVEEHYAVSVGWGSIVDVVGGAADDYDMMMMRTGTWEGRGTGGGAGIGARGTGGGELWTSIIW